METGNVDGNEAKMKNAYCENQNLVFEMMRNQRTNYKHERSTKRSNNG